MPTYVYECAACGHRLEEFQAMSAAPLRKCPACKKAKLQRQIGAGAGVIFKGSGFYQTDYKNQAERTKAGSGDGGSGDGGSGEGKAKKTEGGSKEAAAQETKPAAKKAEGGESKPAPAPDKSAGKAAGSKSGGKSEK